MGVLFFDTIDTSAICHLSVDAATDSTQPMPWTVRRGDSSTPVMTQCDFKTSLLRKVCTDVESEPHLLPITSEILLGRSANTSAEARLDFRGRGFWHRGQNAFFDVRVTNPDCDSQANSSIPSILRKHELEKKREYNERVMHVEQGTFTPLVFTITGSVCSSTNR